MQDNYAKKFLKIAVIFGVLIILVLGFEKIHSIFTIVANACAPFIVGTVIAIILNMPTRFFENKLFRWKSKKFPKLKRGLALLLSIIIFAALITGTCFLIVPRISNVLSDITVKIPPAVVSAINWTESKITLSEEITTTLNEIKAVSTSWDSLFEYFTQNLPSFNSFFDSALALVKFVASSISMAFVSMFFAIYAIMRKEHIAKFFQGCSKALFSEPTHTKVMHFFDVLHRCFEDFIHGQCLECFLVAFIFTIITLCFGFKCSLIMGIIMFFLAFIPYIGNFVAVGIGALMTLVMESPGRAILFIALFAIVQLLDGNFMYPRVIGLKVKMPPLAIFVVVIIAGSLFGIPGMFLSIPIATAFYILLQEKIQAAEPEPAIVPAPEKSRKKKKK